MTGTSHAQRSTGEGYDCVVRRRRCRRPERGDGLRPSSTPDTAAGRWRAQQPAGIGTSAGYSGHDGTPPSELYELARRQLSAYPAVETKDGVAAAAGIEVDQFVITLSGGGEVRTRALVLATGMDYEVPDVPGFAELWGGAVFHCPFCHGWDVRDRRVAVYGPSEIATQTRNPARRRGPTHVFTVDPGDIGRARLDDGALQALVRHDGDEVACDAVLVHAPLRARGQLAQDLGLALTEDGLVRGRRGDAHERPRRLRGW